MAKRKTNRKISPGMPRGRPATAGPRRLWLYGEHAVLAALANPRRQIHRLVLSQTAAGSLEREIGERLGPRRAETELRIERDKAALAELLPAAAVHQGLAAEVSPLVQPALADLETGPSDLCSLLVLLDQVTDPQNVGAILRSACAFGALAVLAPERNAADETGALAKAASGALEAIPYIRVVNLARALDQLKDRGFWSLGLDSEAAETIDRITPGNRVALVLGAEGAGLRRLTRERCDFLARLPTRGPVDQLNVSNAAAVALYALLGSGSGQDVP